MNTHSGAPKLSPLQIEPATSYGDIKRQQAEKAMVKEPSAFKVRAQLLQAGRTDAVLAASEHLTLRLKVYASGGENELHAHANEDHIFIVMDGAAEFSDEAGALVNLSRMQGLLLPKGSRYRFASTGSQPLVMLRIGSPNESALGLEGRLGVDGERTHAIASDVPDTDVVAFPGRFFG